MKKVEEDNSDEEDKSDKEDESENEDKSDEAEKSDEEDPNHVPKKGRFYQHDDRNYVEAGHKGRGPRTDETGRTWGRRKEPKWTRDMFNEEDQRPKEEVKSSLFFNSQPSYFLDHWNITIKKYCIVNLICTITLKI